MSSVLGIDVSTKQLDLAYIDETEDTCVWNRVILEGADAWERTLDIGGMHELGLTFDGVYLVAIEAPYGRSQPGTQALLNRVVGAVAASLPRDLRRAERCWIVRPDEWKGELGLKGKPTRAQVAALIRPRHEWERIPLDQNSLDAACVALYARNVNRAAIEAA